MQYDLEIAVKNNWALLSVSDYLDAFYDLYGFRPDKPRIRKMIQADKIDVVRIDKKVFIVMNDKSTRKVTAHPNDFMLYRKTKWSKYRWTRIKDMPYENQ
jgi:hypothetical protein